MLRSWMILERLLERGGVMIVLWVVWLEREGL